jgi:hypothetical protein
LQDLQECGPDPSDCVVVDFEAKAAVKRKAERVRGSRFESWRHQERDSLSVSPAELLVA